jgi:hypothetical protein
LIRHISSQATYIPARNPLLILNTSNELPAPRQRNALIKDLNPVVQTRLPEDPLARPEKTIERDDRRRRSPKYCRQVVFQRKREWKCSYSYSRSKWGNWGNRGQVAWVCVLREYRTAEVRHRAHGGSERVGESCSHILVGISIRMIARSGGRMYAVRS